MKYKHTLLVYSKDVGQQPTQTGAYSKQVILKAQFIFMHSPPPCCKKGRVCSSQANLCTSSWIRAILSIHLPCHPIPTLSPRTNISQHIHSLALTLDLCSLEAKSLGRFSLGARDAWEQSSTWLQLLLWHNYNIQESNLCFWCGSSSSPFFLNLVRNSCRDVSHLPRYRVHYVYYATLTKLPHKRSDI